MNTNIFDEDERTTQRLMSVFRRWLKRLLQTETGRDFLQREIDRHTPPEIRF
jgi:hypothetical protein